MIDNADFQEDPGNSAKQKNPEKAALDGAEDPGNHVNNKFRVNLSVFEGPIDLLLYLIKKNELDIHEIPLSKITKEYLDYVDLIKMIDIESAGDFIVIASTLLKIKARSLFQAPDSSDGDQEDISTRDELIKYLMEFEKLGGVAEKLAEKEEERHGIFPRGGERSRISEIQPEEKNEPDYMLFDLLTALRDVLKNAPKASIHDVELLNVTAEMKQKEIMGILAEKKEIDFIEYVTGQPKLIIVVTFVAMLELIKESKISIRQSKQFGRIVLYGRTNNKVENN
jgi:segregation and condensation protein A